jgi:hypothetical protein
MQGAEIETRAGVVISCRAPMRCGRCGDATDARCRAMFADRYESTSNSVEVGVAIGARAEMCAPESPRARKQSAEEWAIRARMATLRDRAPVAQQDRAVGS